MIDRNDPLYDLYETLKESFEEFAAGLAEEAAQGVVEAVVVSEVGEGDLAQEYIQSFSVSSPAPDRRQVRFTYASDRIRAVELGFPSFSIKEKMLASPKAKYSAEGHAYRTVPIEKDSLRTSKTNTSKENEVRSKIREVIKGARFSVQAAFTERESGEYTVVDKARGIERTRRFKSREDFSKRARPLEKKHTIFRTMSSKPGTSDWIHPGSSGRDLTAKIQREVEREDSAVYENALEEIFDYYFGR